MRLFKLRSFDRFASKEDITNDALKTVVAKMEAGYINADLGGYVYKERVARQGGGKSGGYRVILFYRQGERVFFAHGFAKSDKANISAKDLDIFKAQADVLMHTEETHITTLLKNGILIEL